MEPREIELKLDIDPGDLDRLRGHPLLDGGRPVATKHLDSVYFDTDGLDVHDAGLTLRVRRMGERRIQTIKADAEDAAGMFDRAEWERDIDGDEPDLEAAEETALAPLLHDGTLRGALRPVFATHVDRTTYQIGGDAFEVELTVDQGRISAGDRSAPLCEVELELKRGQPEELFRLAHDLGQAVPLRLGVESKSARGYALLEDRQPAPVKGKPPRLAPGTPTAAAFQAVARACLHQMMRNEAVLRATRHPDALHQMRVALRRLRAALSLFKEVVADERLETVKSELRWMAGQLGEARDLDVFIAGTLARTRADYPDEPGMAALAKHFENRRAAAYETALEAVRSHRFREMALDTAAWIEAGPWTAAGEGHARRDRPVEKFAAAQLDRRRRKLRKAGGHLRDLSPHDRHQVRIQVKKLRYAAEFFSSLWQGGKADKRRKPFLGALEEVQEQLGALNDIAVSHAMQADLARDGGGRRAFAAGLLAGRQDSLGRDLVKDAAKAFGRFAEAKRFWK